MLVYNIEGYAAEPRMQVPRRSLEPLIAEKPTSFSYTYYRKYYWDASTVANS
jgi:hypothetical protein